MPDYSDHCSIAESTSPHGLENGILGVDKSIVVFSDENRNITQETIPQEPELNSFSKTGLYFRNREILSNH